MFRYLYYSLLYAFSGGREWQEFVDRRTARLEAGKDQAWRVWRSGRKSNGAKSNGAKSNGAGSGADELEAELHQILESLSADEVQQLLAYAEELVRASGNGVAVDRDALITKAREIMRARTDVLERISPEQRQKLRAIAEETLLGACPANGNGRPMTAERQNLIRNAMAVQRAKAHVLNDLSPEQKSRLFTIARKQLPSKN